MIHPKTAERIFRIATSLPPYELSLSDAINLPKAQQLCWDAMECQNRNEVVRLAVEATKLTPFCADAFNLLADLICCNDAEQLLLLNWATRVGEIACRDRITEDTGHLHGFVDARPYMRARTALAETLRRVSCYEEALRHYEELLRLEHNDHIAAAMLMTGYLELRRLPEAKEVIQRFAESGGTHQRYSYVVWCWLSGIREPEFVAALQKALHSNVFVPALLSDPEMQYERSAFGVTLGGADEAAEYITVSHRLWEANPKLKRKVITVGRRLVPKVQAERDAQRREIRRRAGLPDDEAQT
jgi:tetratricopeptide (TPR) repeat protein